MGTIMIFGDICPDNNFRHLFDYGQFGPFDQDVVSEISNSSLVIGNLECPATENKNPIVKCGPNLRAMPKDINLLRRIGFDVLSLANNHILDYGLLSVEETKRECEECGISTVGAGINADDASKPLIVEVEGKKVSILSFAEAEFNLATKTLPGANHFDPFLSYDEIEQSKQQSDYTIVLYHGGIEHYKFPSPLLQKKCRRMIDFGADVVICQHSHCIGTLEKHNGGTIIYGQGNSVFGFKNGNVAWNEGLIIFISLETKTVSFRVIEAKSDGISFLPEVISDKRIEQMLKESEILYNSDEVRGRWIEFCKSQAALYLPLLYGKSRAFNILNRLFHNGLINQSVSRKKRMITMNLIRCESHHDVMQTIFERDIFN